MKRSLPLAIAGALLLSLAASCATPEAPQRTLTVFAAASLNGVFSEIGSQLEAEEPGVAVEFNFAASGRLLLQLEQGARADLFASASPEEIDQAIAAALIDAEQARLFARNRLVVIVPLDNPGDVHALADLGRPGLRLDLADQSAPVGRYALEMLDRMSQDPAYGPEFQARALANVISYEENVRAVVAKVALGEVDAGVVYASDTAGATHTLVAIEVPAAFTPEITYWVAPLAEAREADLAARFIDLLLSAPGADALARHGFESVSPES
jgi:molybdate transport system substrate-binding protein